MTADEVTRSREAQGLPPTVTDAGALARIAALLVQPVAASQSDGDRRAH